LPARPPASGLPSTLVAVVSVLLLGLTLVSGPALAATPPEDPEEPEPPTVVNTAPPSITGEPRFGEVLRVDPGGWEPADATVDVHWLREGRPIKGATAPRFRPRLKDIGTALTVRVRATSGDSTAVAFSEPVRVRKGLLANETRPRIDGSRRFDHTLAARPGSWSRKPDRVRYQWFRDGRPVPGATRPRLHLGLAEFGSRLTVRVTAFREGYRRAQARAPRTKRIDHRVPARHTVTYQVETRGAISADLATFRRQAQATFDDPRGWRGSGVRFVPVAAGGAFSLVLSEASQVPTFSSGCSRDWSCRVGRYVIINQTRWQQASPMWNRIGRTVRDYRHMVVNHETGHWLGHGHRGCPGQGAVAPVMMQQSKGLAGCRANPWPTAPERRTPRFG
jgi:hypothetical protein